MATNYPIVTITAEMLALAKELVPGNEVNRTKASEIDTLTGHLGELAFAQYFYGDFKKNNVGLNKGDMDFPDIEIKASAFPFSNKLNLLVREDYASKRKPPFYIQVIIDVTSTKAKEILPGTKAYITGYATAAEVKKAPAKDFGSKLAEAGGYKSRYIGIKNLYEMNDFGKAFEKYEKEKI